MVIQSKSSNKEVHISVDGEDAQVRAKSVSSAKAKQSPVTAERSRGSSKRKRGGLVQTTLATLFEKVEVKVRQSRYCFDVYEMSVAIHSGVVYFHSDVNLMAFLPFYC